MSIVAEIAVAAAAKSFATVARYGRGRSMPDVPLVGYSSLPSDGLPRSSSTFICLGTRIQGDMRSDSA